jgi:hypothetical protein
MAQTLWQKNHPEQRREIDRRWAKKHPKQIKEKQKNYYAAHHEKLLKRSNDYFIAHHEQCRKNNKQWKAMNPEKCREYNRRATEKRYATLKGNLGYKMSCLIRHSLRKNKNGYHWETLVGFTLVDLKQHIESQFKNGMNWDLFMQGKIHIDHIIPISRFYYEKPEDPEFRICWGLANLQPLWAKDNLSKNNRTMEEWEKHKNGN